MTDFFSLINVPLLGIGVVQGLLLSIILVFQRKGNWKATLMLVIVVFFYSGSISTSFLAFSGLYKVLPHFMLVFYPLERLVGPAFYFYVLFLFYPARSFRWYDVLHIIPMLYILNNMLSFYMLDLDQKIDAIEWMWFGGNLRNTRALTEYLIWEGHSIVYFIATLLFLTQESRKIKKLTSNTAIDFIDWLRQLTKVFIFFILAASFGTILCYYITFPASKSEVVVHLLGTLFIHYIAFTAIRQPDKLFAAIDIDRSQGNNTKSKVDVQGGLERLVQFMEKEKPYLDPNLKVHHLAATLDLTPHLISKVINQEKGMNFYDFVNSYRTEEFKHRVKADEYKHLTLLGIAFDVGFNSKSSFNRIFKKNTGMTPSEFFRSKKVPSSSIGTPLA